MTGGRAMLQFQRQFAVGLLDRGAIDKVAGSLSVPAARYAIYGRNVRVSLVQALANTFNVTRRLVGREFFDSMVSVFITEHPPKQGWLSGYGAEFPDFAASYPPAKAVGYLADVARLEWARVRAADCADQPGLDLNELIGMDSDRLETLTLSLHEAASLVCSPFPIFDIWKVHWQCERDEEVSPVDLEVGRQCILITRPEPEGVVVMLLQPGDAALVAAVTSHAPFGDACRAAAAVERNYELGARLSILARSRAFAAVSP